MHPSQKCRNGVPRADRSTSNSGPPAAFGAPAAVPADVPAADALAAEVPAPSVTAEASAAADAWRTLRLPTDGSDLCPPALSADLLAMASFPVGVDGIRPHPPTDPHQAQRRILCDPPPPRA